MAVKTNLQKSINSFNDTYLQCIEKGFSREEAGYIAEAVYQWERTKLFGTEIKPQEGSRVCKRLPGYVCDGSKGRHHPECQNQPIYTYDQTKARHGI